MGNEESSAMGEDDGDEDSIDDYFRCVQVPDGWASQVGFVEWEGHLPHVEWKTFRRWRRAPTEARKELAEAAALKRWFRTCTHCKQLNNPGHMHDDNLCQGCATDVLGVVY